MNLPPETAAMAGVQMKPLGAGRPRVSSAHLTDAFLRDLGITRKQAEERMSVAASPEQIGSGTTLPQSRGRSQKTLDLLTAIQAIGEACAPLSVRGIAYKLFTQEMIPSMTDADVRRISRIVTNAREDSTIPWAWIVDETRQRECVPTWKDTEERIRSAAWSHRKDHWQLQARRLLVISEKSTIKGVLSPVLDEFAVPFQPFHGWGGATAVHDIAVESAELDHPLIVLYVGDWDPSGMGMSEQDLPGRFSRYQGQVDIRRIALVESDLRELPSFAAKTKKKDPRYKWFTREYGDRCWEVDALDPNVLRAHVKEAITAEIDWAKWTRCARADKAEQESMLLVAKNWKAILRGVRA